MAARSSDPEPAPDDGGRGRRVAYRAVLAVTAILTVLSIFSVWANRQLLNSAAWTDTSTKLLESQAIREQTSAFLTDQLYANVDVEGQLQGLLPVQLKPLAGTAAAAARTVVEDAGAKALERPRLQATWSAVNRTAHEKLVRVIEDEGTFTSIQRDTVVLDLRPILVSTAARVGIPPAVQEKIPPDAARVQILQADQLQLAQGVAKALKAFDWILRLLVLLGLGLAMCLARGRRAEALVACGGVLVVAGFTALLARPVAGGMVVDRLVPTAAVRPAATAAWDIGTGLLTTMAWSTIFVGVPAIIVGLLVGHASWARALRARLAPVTRRHPEFLYGASVLIVLFLIAWEPVPATRKPVPILLFLLVIVGGASPLRRLTLEENPEPDGLLPAA